MGRHLRMRQNIHVLATTQASGLRIVNGNIKITTAKAKRRKEKKVSHGGSNPQGQFLISETWPFPHEDSLKFLNSVIIVIKPG